MHINLMEFINSSICMMALSVFIRAFQDFAENELKNDIITTYECELRLSTFKNSFCKNFLKFFKHNGEAELRITGDTKQAKYRVRRKPQIERKTIA